MFLKKVKQCSVVFDFTKAINITEAEQKEIKRHACPDPFNHLLASQRLGR